MTTKPAFEKGYREIAKEWDRIAPIRLKQIESGQDLSYNHVIIPTIIEILDHCDLTEVIDLGCGCGYLTRLLAKKAKSVIGVDISEKSIDLAKKRSSEYSNIDYVHIDIESYSSLAVESSFSTAIANMTLMDVLFLDKVIKTVKLILKPQGHFIFTITHPCYWPVYWNYEKAQWFNYWKEIPIEADFSISLEKNRNYTTTHIHRPLEMYINCLTKFDFEIVKIVEPLPPREILLKYPKKWEYPRFLAVHCVSNKT